MLVNATQVGRRPGGRRSVGRGRPRARGHHRTAGRREGRHDRKAAAM